MAFEYHHVWVVGHLFNACGGVKLTSVDFGFDCYLF